MEDLTGCVRSPVSLEIEDEALRQALATTLANLGITVAEPSRLPDSIVLRNVRGADTDTSPRTVQVWTGNRSNRAVNPFGARALRHILGAQRIDERELCSTLQQVEHNDLVEFTELMGPGLSVEEYYASSSDEKAPLLEKLRTFLAARDAQFTLVSSLELCLDELYTNAIYNAPMDDGARLYAHLSRSTQVTSPRPVTVRFGHSDNFFGVAVRDQFGSLAAEAVLDNLFRCYRTASPAPLEKEGGAGLGFFLLLQNASRLVVNISPHDHCEVIVLRRSRERGREFAQHCPTLNICVDGSRRYDLERRRERRQVVAWPARVTLGGRSYEATVLDISVHGLFASLPEGELPASGEAVTLLLTATGREPRSVAGVVAWKGWSRQHRQYGFGVRFSAPSVELACWGEEDDPT